MKIYVINGDNLKILRTCPDNYFDSVVTDPPYGINFMGKKWDYDVPKVEVWEEVLRVLKPGGHILVACGTRTQHRMAVNIEDAGFEIRDVVSWIYGCYSDDTEVLTQRGWLHHSDLRKNDQILQWNKDSNKLSWIIPLNKFEYDIDDEMVLFENRHTSQLITKNHSVFAKIRKHSRNPKSMEFEKIEAGQIRKNWQIDLPLAGELKSGIDVDYPYLLGWWMTDAWVHGDGKVAMFSQSKPCTLSKLRNELNRIGASYSEYTKKPKKDNHKDEHSFYVTGEIADYLLSNYRNREFDWDVLQWSFNDRMMFLEGLLDGDGSRREKTDGHHNYSEVFWSRKKKRLDIVQSICLSLNIRSHIDFKKGCVYLNREHNTTQLQVKYKKPLQPYRGKVWCLETETGAFVVRRNGRAFISGNSGFPKSLDVSKAIDKMKGAKREVVGQLKTNTKMQGNNYAGEREDKKGGVVDVTTPATDEAKQWDGWGTALKPACEFFTLARKPLSEKTVAANVLKWGTGAINIDECRIELNGDYKCKANGRPSQTGLGDNYDSKNANRPDNKGRFPANLVHDGSEEVVSLFPDKAGARAPVKGTEPSHTGQNGIYNPYGRVSSELKDGIGSAARFFYTPKASKKERGEGNSHPTVKPVKLMEYLVKLITPPKGKVLDLYAGSGATGLACQNLGFGCVLIEKEKKYCDIIQSRLKQ